MCVSTGGFCLRVLAMTTLVSAVDVVRSTFNFSVDKFPLSGPDNMPTPYYGLFKSDDGECLNAVSDKYYVHTTDDVVALTEAAQTAFDDSVTVSAYWRKGHHITIQPSADQRRSVFGTKDNVFPRFLLHAGYNDTPISCSLGFWRDACSNLCRLRSVSGTHTSIKHLGSARGRMDELISVFQGLKEGWATLTETIAHMEAKKVSLVDFLQAVYPIKEEATQAAITRQKNTIRDIFKRVQDERWKTGRPSILGSFEVSAFEAFQGVHGNVFWSDKKGKGVSNELARFLNAERSQFVARAESLAVSV